MQERYVMTETVCMVCLWKRATLRHASDTSPTSEQRHAWQMGLPCIRLADNGRNDDGLDTVPAIGSEERLHTAWRPRYTQHTIVLFLSNTAHDAHQLVSFPCKPFDHFSLLYVILCLGFVQIRLRRVIRLHSWTLRLLSSARDT